MMKNDLKLGFEVFLPSSSFKKYFFNNKEICEINPQKEKNHPSAFFKMSFFLNNPLFNENLPNPFLHLAQKYYPQDFPEFENLIIPDQYLNNPFLKDFETVFKN